MGSGMERRTVDGQPLIEGGAKQLKSRGCWLVGCGVLCTGLALGLKGTALPIDPKIWTS